ncbi:MAG: hydroxyacylglutathione hydrolase [Alphaproteobacteria bacterium]|nr:hydroxyacylglutathione hydrolase [Alphaproteobacteria bacterium]
MALDVTILPVLKDNYNFVIRAKEDGTVAVVDPSGAEPINAALRERGWRLTHILNTHHHADHTGGNLELKSTWGATVVGPRADAARIPGIDVQVGDGDVWMLGGEAAHVMDVPGHTRGHIAYWFSESNALFCGDTLFSLGCGRLFEGTPAQMWRSLSMLRGLPDHTKVYCAHEYTQSNARFALSLEPESAGLKRQMAWIEEMRAAGRPTIPSALGKEKDLNPFLRADEAPMARAVGLAGADPVAVFAEIRRRKDAF